MRHCILALLFTLCPSAISAETVTIGSGEHPGFTRLTFNVGAEFDWAIGRIAGGYELRLNVDDLSYDTAKVFSRVPRTRLLDLVPGDTPGSLRLETECECHVSAFLFRPGILVVDLKDGAPKDGSSFETPPPDVLGLRAEWKPRPRPYEKQTYDWLEDIDLTEAARLPEIGLSIKPEEEAASQVETAQMYLAEQLGRAATQGIVELSVAKTTASKASQEQPDPPATSDDHGSLFADTTGEPKLPKAEANAHMRLTATTAIDLANGRAQRLDLTAQGEECPDPARFAIAWWGDERPAAIQIAEARQNLVGEFDRINEDNVIKLAKLYLYFGFGAEAEQLIEEMRVKRADPALTIIAGILDNLHETPGVPGKASCASVVALWAVLADQLLLASDPIDKGAVMLAFSELPLHLRQLLGPRLANRFIELHDSPSARKISDMILRAPNQHGPEVALMQAEIALADGKSDKAIRGAEEIVGNGGPLAAEATLLLIETSFAKHTGLPAGTYDLVSSLAREQRGSALEPRLKRARVLAAILQNDYEIAFELMAGLKDPSIAEATGQDLWTSLLDQPDGEVFIAHTIPKPDKLPTALDTVGFAERLLGLGFAELANDWLPEEISEDEDTRLVAAKVALDLGDAKKSLRLSAGLSGPDADALRGRALEKLGDLSLAAEAYARAGDKPSQISALWRSGNIDELRENAPEDPRLVWAPSSVGAPDDPLINPEKPLAQGRALVEASGQTRALVEALLQTQAMQAPAGY